METKVTTLREALAEASVPEPGTRERIEYIDLDDIQPDPRNFYELSGIDELAANIELFGLQQPLRVRDDPMDPDKVILVSGHRRRAAMEKLVAEGREDLREIPCIREREAGSEALQELRLIYANSDTRKMTSAEVSRQAQRVEELLYQLKEEGHDFPGRMRDHVAEACKVSKSKLSRLKVIREGLIPRWHEIWSADGIPEETAYQIARLPKEHQQRCLSAAEEKNRYALFYASDAEQLGKALAELEEKVPDCPKHKVPTPCPHLPEMKRKTASKGNWYHPHCTGQCCLNCLWLEDCKDFCPHGKAEKDRIKRQAKEAKAKRKADEAAREAPLIERKKLLWQRMAQARAAAGKSVEDVFNACGRYYGSAFEKSFLEHEAGTGKLTGSDETPYGYMFSASDAIGLCAVADLLGVSIDYLLGRTETPKPVTVEVPKDWQPGKPPRSGRYFARFRDEAGTMTFPCEYSVSRDEWSIIGGMKIEAPCTGWWWLPEEED